MRFLLDTLGALYQLARLAVVTRFAFKGPYWTWRLQTAFGIGVPASRPGRLQTLAAVLEYGRWVHRMRRGL